MAEVLNQEQLYDKFLQVILAASQLPYVKINRKEFLKAEFKDSEHLDVILRHGPQVVYSSRALRKRASRLINNATNKTAILSLLAGLPSNPVVAVAAGSADVIQYFGFALNLSQQIAYLFGEDELFSENNKELPEEVKIRIVAYLGIMFGAGGAGFLIQNVFKKGAANVGKKVAQKALMKTAWYPIVKKVGAILGNKVTKATVEKVVAKTIPILGGVISGGITFATFRPMGERLADTFEKLLNGEIIVDKDSVNELNQDFDSDSYSDDIIDGTYTEK